MSQPRKLVVDLLTKNEIWILFLFFTHSILYFVSFTNSEWGRSSWSLLLVSNIEVDWDGVGGWTVFKVNVDSASEDFIVLSSKLLTFESDVTTSMGWMDLTNYHVPTNGPSPNVQHLSSLCRASSVNQHQCSAPSLPRTRRYSILQRQIADGFLRDC
jgi:hypothetical protein